MSEQQGSPSSDSSKRRKRRRRRSSGGGGGSRSAQPAPKVSTPAAPELGERQSFGRRQVVEVAHTTVSTPAPGRNPHRKRNSRPKRNRPSSATTRRRRLSAVDVESITDWLAELPTNLLGNLYRALGGQPKRVGSPDRMIQLAARALAQGGRLDALLKQSHDKDRQALAALLQAGGIAHAGELHRELMSTYGGSEREWKRSLAALADKGILMASDKQDDDWMYIVPDPLIDSLLMAVSDELKLPTFDSEEIRVLDHRPFNPPLDFSITSLATYFSQTNVRLTQRHEVYRHDKEAMDEFFAQLWTPDSELFQFHLDFLMMHGMVELIGDHISLNRELTEEWLQLEPEDQRDLIFRALDGRFEMAEWVLWAIHGADGEWIAERPLQALYRRWKRGRDWQTRYASGSYGSTRSHERETYSFSGLVQTGLLEMGMWGQEKFYRLTERARVLLEPEADDGFRQFYLTPDFKMMAPAGLAPILLFRMGELAELKGIDRANTYQITEESIERALDAGWRRDDVLQFLRDNSQLGLPENVEDTLKGWIGHRGDVEFHDLMVLTVHRSQIRRFENNKRVKPYVLHRFAPGLYAVDRSKQDEIARVLADSGFSPSKEIRSYPGSADVVEAREQLVKMLIEAREDAREPTRRSADLVDPSRLRAVPGSRSASTKKAKAQQGPPLVDPAQARTLINQALVNGTPMEMVYLAKNGQRLPMLVEPDRLAFKGESPVLVGYDLGEKERRTFVIDRIERLRLKESE